MIASISKAKLFKACRRAYYFRYIEDLVPVESAEALQVGTNYHELLENLYKEGYVESGYSREHAMAKAYEKYIFPKFKVISVEDWKQRNIGRHTLIGRLDGIAEDGCIVEHKTTSSEITEAYLFDLQWDEQILAYMYLTGSRKIYYTVCRKPTIRLKRDEDEADFFFRMLDWYKEDTDSKIKLLEITRTDEEVLDFAKEFSMLCDIMEKPDCLYKNTAYCNKWGRRCEYASICLNYDPNQEYIEFKKREM